jgi:hypothetical protein
MSDIELTAADKQQIAMLAIEMAQECAVSTPVGTEVHRAVHPKFAKTTVEFTKYPKRDVVSVDFTSNKRNGRAEYSPHNDAYHYD